MSAVMVLGAAMILAAAIVGAAYLRTPLIVEAPAAEPAPTAPPALEPAAPTFDEHTAGALALADPGQHPDLPDDESVIGDAIAAAVEQLASAIAAARAGLDVDVVIRLRDQAYECLYRSLTHAEATRALVAALHEDAEERAAVLVNQFRSLPTTDRRAK